MPRTRQTSYHDDLKKSLNTIMSDCLQNMQKDQLFEKQSDQHLYAFISSELSDNQYEDFQEFEQLINSIFFSKLQTISNYEKLKDKQIQLTKKFVLETVMQDVMNDYQRLTYSEADKYDKIYGEIMNSASRALYSEMGSVAFEDNVQTSAKINFRNINVDEIYHVSLDLFQYLRDRDQKFKV